MPTLAPDVTVDRYRLLAPVGEGGQSSVWRAEDPLHPGAPVALKLVPTRAAAPGGIERFRREARSLARLAHPCLPRCYALFEDRRHDVLGLALDFIEGRPLDALLSSEALTPEHRVWILRHLAGALAYVHEAGLVHRDVKPQNVMIGERFFERPEDAGGLKLVDFGIAVEPSDRSVLGTIGYLAPELLDRGCWSGPADGPERDVFALGVLAHELLRGEHPAGVAAGAPLDDLLAVYREHQRDEAWPPGVAGDPLEAFYRGTLALHAGARARDGAAAAALLPAGKTAPRAEVARAEIADSSLLPVLSRSPRARAASALRIAGFAASTAALFGVAFYLSYARPFEGAADVERPSTNAEEPPNPVPPARPAATFPAWLRCPPGMIKVAGAPPFCLDEHEVTVAEYRACAACGAARDAKAEPSQRCAEGRAGFESHPINCVSFQDASTYCAWVEKRLPGMAEWREARAVVTLCKEAAGVCPLFEWASDPTPHKGHRAARGPSFRSPDALESSHVEAARNDDLGFRCARDLLPR